MPSTARPIREIRENLRLAIKRIIRDQQNGALLYEFHTSDGCQSFVEQNLNFINDNFEDVVNEIIVNLQSLNYTFLFGYNKSSDYVNGFINHFIHSCVKFKILDKHKFQFLIDEIFSNFPMDRSQSSYGVFSFKSPNFIDELFEHSNLDLIKYLQDNPLATAIVEAEAREATCIEQNSLFVQEIESLTEQNQKLKNTIKNNRIKAIQTLNRLIIQLKKNFPILEDIKAKGDNNKQKEITAIFQEVTEIERNIKNFPEYQDLIKYALNLEDDLNKTIVLVRDYIQEVEKEKNPSLYFAAYKKSLLTEQENNFKALELYETELGSSLKSLECNEVKIIKTNEEAKQIAHSLIVWGKAISSLADLRKELDAAFKESKHKAAIEETVNLSTTALFEQELGKISGITDDLKKLAKMLDTGERKHRELIVRLFSNSNNSKIMTDSEAAGFISTINFDEIFKELIKTKNTSGLYALGKLIEYFTTNYYNVLSLHADVNISTEVLNHLIGNTLLFNKEYGISILGPKFFNVLLQRTTLPLPEITDKGLLDKKEQGLHLALLNSICRQFANLDYITWINFSNPLLEQCEDKLLALNVMHAYFNDLLPHCTHEIYTFLNNPKLDLKALLCNPDQSKESQELNIRFITTLIDTFNRNNKNPLRILQLNINPNDITELLGNSLININTYQCVNLLTSLSAENLYDKKTKTNVFSSINSINGFTCLWFKTVWKEFSKKFFNQSAPSNPDLTGRFFTKQIEQAQQKSQAVAQAYQEFMVELFTSNRLADNIESILRNNNKLKIDGDNQVIHFPHLDLHPDVITNHINKHTTIAARNSVFNDWSSLFLNLTAENVYNPDKKINVFRSLFNVKIEVHLMRSLIEQIFQLAFSANQKQFDEVVAKSFSSAYQQFMVDCLSLSGPVDKLTIEDQNTLDYAITLIQCYNKVRSTHQIKAPRLDFDSATLTRVIDSKPFLDSTKNSVIADTSNTVFLLSHLSESTIYSPATQTQPGNNIFEALFASSHCNKSFTIFLNSHTRDNGIEKGSNIFCAIMQAYEQFAENQKKITFIKGKQLAERLIKILEINDLFQTYKDSSKKPIFKPLECKLTLELFIDCCRNNPNPHTLYPLIEHLPKEELYDQATGKNIYKEISKLDNFDISLLKVISSRKQEVAEQAFAEYLKEQCEAIFLKIKQKPNYKPNTVEEKSFLVALGFLKNNPDFKPKLDISLDQIIALYKSKQIDIEKLQALLQYCELPKQYSIEQLSATALTLDDAGAQTLASFASRNQNQIINDIKRPISESKFHQLLTSTKITSRQKYELLDQFADLNKEDKIIYLLDLQSEDKIATYYNSTIGLNFLLNKYEISFWKTSKIDYFYPDSIVQRILTKNPTKKISRLNTLLDLNKGLASIVHIDQLLQSKSSNAPNAPLNYELLENIPGVQSATLDQFKKKIETLKNKIDVYSKTNKFKNYFKYIFNYADHFDAARDLYSDAEFKSAVLRAYISYNRSKNLLLDANDFDMQIMMSSKTWLQDSNVKHWPGSFWKYMFSDTYYKHYFNSYFYEDRSDFRDYINLDSNTGTLLFQHKKETATKQTKQLMQLYNYYSNNVTFFSVLIATIGLMGEAAIPILNKQLAQTTDPEKFIFITKRMLMAKKLSNYCAIFVVACVFANIMCMYALKTKQYMNERTYHRDFVEKTKKQFSLEKA